MKVQECMQLNHVSPEPQFAPRATGEENASTCAYTSSTGTQSPGLRWCLAK